MRSVSYPYCWHGNLRSVSLDKHVRTVNFQLALLYCGSDSTSVSAPAAVLRDGLDAEITFCSCIQRPCQPCLHTYRWFIFHLRSITEIAGEVVGRVREFKWRLMSQLEFAGSKRVRRKKEKCSPASCCPTDPVSLRDSRSVQHWWASSPAGDAGLVWTAKFIMNMQQFDTKRPDASFFVF